MIPAKTVLIGAGSHSFGLMTLRDLMLTPEFYGSIRCSKWRQIVELLGTRGGDWEILATSAFVSIAVPLVVFFTMQRYLVRGLLAGSVK